MFMSDLSRNLDCRSMDLFSMYCKNEGLDKIYTWNLIKEEAKMNRKAGRRAAYPWKLLKKRSWQSGDFIDS